MERGGYKSGGVWGTSYSDDLETSSSDADTFEGPADQPRLAVAARELVAASLAQSEIVTPITQAQLKRGLALAMMPDTTRVVGEVARQLAYRATAKTYVEGRVDRVLSGYSIILRVLDTEGGQLVASVNDIAVDEGAFISTLHQLGSQLREEIGEKDNAVRAARPLTEVFTHSFEAYHNYLHARRLMDDGEHSRSREVLQEALRLDPDFARAWFSLGATYWNEGLYDSMRAPMEEAIARPHRLTEHKM